MPIVSSLVKEDRVQADGRRWIREHYIDQLGLIHERAYMALASHIIDLNAQIATLNQQLIDQEIQQNIARIYESGALAVVVVEYATLADNRAGLRAAYATATREQVYALGSFLNTLTNTQLGNLFNVSGAALTSLRTRLQTVAAKWTDYLAAAGE